MKDKIIGIELYDKREKASTTVYVQTLGENWYKMVDNDLLNYRLTRGTEFETRINKDGKHELIRVTKESDLITRRFVLSIEYREPDYRMLGEELTKRGGFWQVDMGGIATINIPKDFENDIDQVMQDLDIRLSEF